jgi:hypothetical protein
VQVRAPLCKDLSCVTCDPEQDHLAKVKLEAAEAQYELRSTIKDLQGDLQAWEERALHYEDEVSRPADRDVM